MIQLDFSCSTKTGWFLQNVSAGQIRSTTVLFSEILQLKAAKLLGPLKMVLLLLLADDWLAVVAGM